MRPRLAIDHEDMCMIDLNIAGLDISNTASIWVLPSTDINRLSSPGNLPRLLDWCFDPDE